MAENEQDASASIEGQEPQNASENGELIVEVHPGDVVQVTDANNVAVGCLLIVEGTYSWGIGATMQWVTHRRVYESYHRLRPGQFTVVGAAPLVKPDVLAARRAMIGTAKLLRNDG